ncbi:hypothetical protein MTR72_38700 [Bradyrhizobium sp. ISRA442]|uniref:hypothetical protein n=1 Tax=Bradyrhizobium sp. ISRA442 TaxID=2866197 RepID=UPI00311ADF9A
MQAERLSVDIGFNNPTETIMPAMSKTPHLTDGLFRVTRVVARAIWLALDPADEAAAIPRSLIKGPNSQGAELEARQQQMFSAGF